MSVTINLPEKLEAKITEMKRLQHIVNEREFEATQSSGCEINYSNFPEYTKLHNLNREVKDEIANIACFELDINEKSNA